MSESFVAADADDNFWRLTGAKVGRLIGMKWGDDAMSTTVSMTLTVEDFPDKPARFCLRAGDAERLAAALLDCAARARAEGAVE